MDTALVVDDDPCYRELLERLLAPLFEVASASDGTQALAACRARAPSVILLDLSLPGLGGAEVLRALAAGGPVPPVVALTAGRPAPALRRELAGNGSVVCLLDKLTPAREVVAAARRAVDGGRGHPLQSS